MEELNEIRKQARSALVNPHVNPSQTMLVMLDEQIRVLEVAIDELRASLIHIHQRLQEVENKHDL